MSIKMSIETVNLNCRVSDTMLNLKKYNGEDDGNVSFGNSIR